LFNTEPKSFAHFISSGPIENVMLVYPPFEVPNCCYCCYILYDVRWSLL